MLYKEFKMDLNKLFSYNLYDIDGLKIVSDFDIIKTKYIKTSTKNINRLYFFNQGKYFKFDIIKSIRTESELQFKTSHIEQIDFDDKPRLNFFEYVRYMTEVENENKEFFDMIADKIKDKYPEFLV